LSDVRPVYVWCVGRCVCDARAHALLWAHTRARSVHSPRAASAHGCPHAASILSGRGSRGVALLRAHPPANTLPRRSRKTPALALLRVSRLHSKRGCCCCCCDGGACAPPSLLLRPTLKSTVRACAQTRARLVSVMPVLKQTYSADGRRVQVAFKDWMIHRSRDSHQLSQFAAFFIVAGAKRSIVKSCHSLVIMIFHVAAPLSPATPRNKQHSYNTPCSYWVPRRACACAQARTHSTRRGAVTVHTGWICARACGVVVANAHTHTHTIIIR
jgi:hypothetical protein